MNILQSLVSIIESWGTDRPPLDKKAFKRQEFDMELGHEKQQHLYGSKPGPRGSVLGPFIIIIDGKPWSKGGKPVVFDNSAMAQAALRTIVRNNKTASVSISRLDAIEQSKLSKYY